MCCFRSDVLLELQSNINNMDTTSLTYKDRREFPVLYKKDAKGVHRFWKVIVTDDTVLKLYGIVDGSPCDNKRVFKANRNQSAHAKAVSSATTDWINSIGKKGYAPESKEGKEMMEKLLKAQTESGGHNINAVSAVTGSQKKKTVKRKKTDTLMVAEVKGGVFIPMKAHTWDLTDIDDLSSVATTVMKYFCDPDPNKKDAFLDKPFYGQPKLDGWRSLFRYQLDAENNPEIVITSNSGKQFPWFKKLRSLYLSWLARARKEMGEGAFWTTMQDGFDGEVYTQVIRGSDNEVLSEEARFSAITSICGLSRGSPHELEDQIQHHVFDLADRSGTLTQDLRFERLDKLFSYQNKEEAAHIIRVKTKTLASVREVPAYLKECQTEGYEGCIVRTKDLVYGGRSRCMRKFKEFIDAEYEVVGCKLDPGVAVEQFVWLCNTTVTDPKSGETVEKTFKAKPMGTKAEKIKMYNRKEEFFGRLLCVKFQEYSADGIPRFPVAKEFREPGDV